MVAEDVGETVLGDQDEERRGGTDEGVRAKPGILLP